MAAGPHQLAARPAGPRVPLAQLGEGPRWDAGSQSLYWVDIPAGYVHRLNGSGVHACWQVGQPVSAVAVRVAGGLLLAARDGFLAVDQRSGAVSLLAAVETGRPDNRMNDAHERRAAPGQGGAQTVAARQLP